MACHSSPRRLPPARRPVSGACPDIRRSNRPCATRISTASVFPASMSLPRLNPIEPPWYGPVCPVVWEGWRREASPYPDHCPKAATCPSSEPGLEAAIRDNDEPSHSGELGSVPQLSTHAG